MHKIIIFGMGGVLGALASYFYVVVAIKGAPADSGLFDGGGQKSTSASSQSNESGFVSSAGSLSVSSNTSQLSSAGSNPLLIDEGGVEYLMQAFQRQTDNFYSSNEFKDLAYLVRHSKSIAEQVRNRIMESQSYDERMSLAAVLAGDESQETLAFAASLIQVADSDTQNLGFEILLSMGDRSNTQAINTILLDAVVHESDPQALSNIINLLSAGTLDEPSKARASESFQRLVSRGEDSTVTARAIDGLSRVGTQDAIYMAVVDHLIDPDPGVKTAAISAINALDKDKVSQEMIETLKSIAGDSEEPSIVREYASMILDGF